MDAHEVLLRLGSGQLLDELHEALLATAAEVVATGNSGRVTLTLTLTTKRQGDPLITIDESIGRTPPKTEPRGAFFWAIGGELHKDDPRQMPIVFRTVDTQTGEIRGVDSEREERTLR